MKKLITLENLRTVFILTFVAFVIMWFAWLDLPIEFQNAISQIQLPLPLKILVIAIILALLGMLLIITA